MKEIRVSVITPSYNQGEFIEETIKSVISQEGDFFLEYLIMDGGSTDETVSIIKKYDALIKEGKWPLKCKGIKYIWVSEKDKGQTDAVNKGFRKATGEILGWLNSDDTYIPGAIKRALDFFASNPDVKMAYGEGYYIDRDGKIIERYFTEKFALNRLYEVCFICQPTVFLKRSVLDEVGFLDDRLNYCMDYEYWIRIAKKLKIGYLPDYQANSRLYPETKTLSKRKEVIDEIIKTVKTAKGDVPYSWISGYASELLNKNSSKPQKGKLFASLWALVFIYKSFVVNRKIPFSEIKAWFYDSEK